MDDMAAAAHAAIASCDWAAVRLLLHPYLHWTQADGVVVRGRGKVLAMLEGDSSAPDPRRRVEFATGESTAGSPDFTQPDHLLRLPAVAG
jgi:hypothetical protein